MTLDRYRLATVLRWQDLVRQAQEEPVRNLHRRLRKLREWPTCAAYEELFGMGIVIPPDDLSSKKNSSHGRTEQSDRKKSSRSKRPKDREPRAALPKGVSGGVSGIIPQGDRDFGTAEGSMLRGVEEVVRDNADRYGMPIAGVSKRSYSRAVKNNAYIDKRVSEIESTLAKTKANRDSLPSGAKRDHLSEMIRRQSRGISRLSSERSDVPDAPRDAKKEYPSPFSVASSSISEQGVKPCSHPGHHVLCPQCERCVFGNTLCPKCTRVLSRYGGVHPLSRSKDQGHRSEGPLPHVRVPAQHSIYWDPSNVPRRCDRCGRPWDGSHQVLSTRVACEGPSWLSRVEPVHRSRKKKRW